VGQLGAIGWQSPAPVEDGGAPPEATEGHGGDGPPLLICLGNDPSATLTGLYSQRPRQACILYDAQTPYVVALAKRLSALGGELPVGTVQFVPTRLRGGSITTDLVRTLFSRPEDVWANVGPGSKAQAWALGRLEHVRLCSLENRKRQVAVCESGAPDHACVPQSRWALPATLVQAECAGGRLAALALDNEALAKQRNFYGLLARYIGRYAFFDSGMFPMKSRSSKSGKQADSIRVSRLPTGEGYAVQVTFKGRTQEGQLKAPTESLGMWLEEVVAAELLAAGGRDAVAGIRWKHLYERQGRDKDEFRTDIDAACQWQGAFVAASVKTYLPVHKDPAVVEQTLDDWRQEILAEAKACFGRYCLPVLVRPLPRAATDLERVLGEFRLHGVLELGICRLADTAYVRQLLNAAFGDRQTSTHGAAPAVDPAPRD